MQDLVLAICVLFLIVIIIYSFYNKPTSLQVYLRLITSVVLLGVIWLGLWATSMPTKVALSVVAVSTLIKAVSDLRKIRSNTAIQRNL
jgi:ABC-type proline/glycine betaine transport system permease subunit